MDIKIEAAQKLFDQVKTLADDPLNKRLFCQTQLMREEYSMLYLYAFMENADDQQLKDLAQAFPAVVYVFLKAKGRLYDGLIQFSVQKAMR